jgi:serine/threonine protein kinase
MEFCDAGSVSDLIEVCHIKFKENEIAIILKCILKGLSYLHERKKIHRDIKAANILINAKGELKICKKREYAF